MRSLFGRRRPRPPSALCRVGRRRPNRDRIKRAAYSPRRSTPTRCHWNPGHALFCAICGRRNDRLSAFLFLVGLILLFLVLVVLFLLLVWCLSLGRRGLLLLGYLLLLDAGLLCLAIALGLLRLAGVELLLLCLAGALGLLRLAGVELLLLLCLASALGLLRLAGVALLLLLRVAGRVVLF